MAISALVLVLVSQPAIAADTEAATTAPDTGLGDIVVTAMRRETNLQKTPIAMSVVGGDSLADRHAQSLISLADGTIPSLRIATFEARQSALTVGIRGIVPFDQNQTAREPGVGVYLDGVYLGRSQGLNAALFDVERIEVLKGPQGTLFGRNTEGGAVSIVTRAPSGEWDGRASAGFGNYGSYEGQLHIDMPAIAGIAFKIDGIIQNQDATTKNPLPGAKGWNAYNRYGGRIAARWQPFEGFTADLSYDTAQDNNTPFYSQLVNYNPGRLNLDGTRQAPLPVGIYNGTQLMLNGASCVNGRTCIAPLAPQVQVHDTRQSVADTGAPQQWSEDRTSGFHATLRYKLSPALELRSITAWRQVTTDQWDNSGGPERGAFVPNAAFSRYSLSWLKQSQFSQEFQAVGSARQLDYAFGLYYFTENVREMAATPSTNQWNTDGTAYTILSQHMPLLASTPCPANQGWDDWRNNGPCVQRDSHAKAHSYAAYGQATYTPDFADRLHLTVGGRYTWDKRVGALVRVNGVVTDHPLDYKKGRFDPLVSLAFDAAGNAHLYAKFATGYRAGGANARSSAFNEFAPESITSYEIGAKMDLLDRKLRVNLAAYMMSRKNTQVDFDYVDTTPFLANGAANPTFNLHTQNTANALEAAKIRGIELDMTARPIDNLTLGLSYAYTHVAPMLAKNPLEGSTFGVLTPVFTVFTPAHAASGTIDYRIPLTGSDANIRIHLDAAYAGPQYSFQDQNLKVDSSFIVNGSLALADLNMVNGTRATISVWTRNLLNEQHIYRRSAENAATLGDYANFNAPRTFGGTIAFNF
ncbi:MAG: TonB-dependent receptor [Novosphingobium sp.]|jgi:iron complex outermembrane receptor protein|nr:TonB-dependent receptor [Novosphingobium sp.]